MKINSKEMTSIFYLSRVDLSVKRAHVHNIAKTCESLAKIKDVQMTLVSTSFRLKKTEKEDFLKEHQIIQEFPIIVLNSFSNYLQWSRFRAINWLEVILANFTLVRFLFTWRKKIDIIYFRDQHLFLAVLFGKYFLRKPVFFEVHAAKRKAHIQALLNLMVKNSDGIIAISHALKRYYEKLNKNIIVAFCLASQKEDFPYHKNKEELRQELNLPLDKIIVGYTGRLDLRGVHSNYQVDKIVGALKFLPQEVLFLIIGGQEREAELLKKTAQDLGVDAKLRVYPRLSRLKMPAYLLAFDILVIPKLGDLPGDSPAKMFEYLAAKRPIVAAKTEPVSEVLRHEENALLVYPNTSEEWSKAIKRLINDEDLMNRISQKAFKDSEQYTWQKRAERIAGFIAGK
ncbi:MAG: glycosyltransferase [Candidatus Nealsonbacteria bacterium]|nr:glycosyltransferase [Candidatus Nealsonbacteria bacterium]